MRAPSRKLAACDVAGANINRWLVQQGFALAYVKYSSEFIAEENAAREPPKHKFTDYTLNPNVAYAKHAISIDENRHDFPRVRWNPDAKRSGTRDSNGNIFFEQVWFSGVHADVGGGYPENESRLSDVTLQWMLAAASLIPDGIRHNAGVLHLHPDATGPQHDECKAGRWQRGARILPADTAGVSHATTLHSDWSLHRHESSSYRIGITRGSAGPLFH